MKAPAKIVCLESYWNEKLFQNFSVKGFFEAMAPLAHPPLVVAHRFVESEAGLEYYTKRGGVLWRQKELFDAPVFYLAFHGAPGAVKSVLGRIDLRRIFASVQRDYPRAKRLGQTLFIREAK